LFKFIVVILILLNFLLIRPILAQDKPELLWLVEDSQENLNLGTPLAPTTSTSTYTEDLILSKLTQYQITLQRVSMKRIDAQLKNKDNVCAASRIKTKQRLKYSLYSKPQNIYLSHKIYRLANKSPLSPAIFDTLGNLKSLYHLFGQYPDSILAIADGVSYGKILDNQISHLNKDNLYNRGGSHRVVAINEMLFKDRVDFIIYYPTEIKLLLSEPDILESYHIAGTEPYILGHFTCSNSEFGKQVISDINNILSDAYTTEDFYNAHSRWLLPSDIKKLNLYYIKTFGKQSFIK